MRGWFGRWMQLLIVLLVIVVGWWVVSGRARHWWPGHRPLPAVVDAPPAAASAPPGGWTAVAKSAMPAVVNIASAKIVRGPQGSSAPFFADPFFRRFFNQEPAPRRERSLGSGVLVTRDGYVLTNNHVIEGAQEITVTLADRREMPGRLVGADPMTDLAVLKLAGSDFSLLPLGDSSKVDVAEVVLAIGSPFGLGQTVTMGIVSAVGRANLGIADYEDFIQTDAAINPGNSGGALISTSGALIGINTAIFSESGGYMGIGFAVPVNMARQVMDQLITHGHITRGFLGVAVQEVTPAIGRGLGVPAEHGTLVADVTPDGPAARAGIRRGDVITAVDGKPVNDVGHFRNLIAATAPGTKITLSLLRDRKEQTLEVTTAEAPQRPRPVAERQAPSAAPDQPSLSVADLTPELARRLGPAVPTSGAVVTQVAPGGLAAEAGLRPGDVIVELNGRPVRSAQDVQRELQQASGHDVVAVVNRGGTTAYVVIERA